MAHHYEVDADQELNAHGVVNLVSGLLGGMIAGGGMSASAVKEGAGARTQLANLIAWGVTIVTLLFLTPLFAPLPEAVLAALQARGVHSTAVTLHVGAGTFQPVRSENLAEHRMHSECYEVNEAAVAAVARCPQPATR